MDFVARSIGNLDPAYGQHIAPDAIADHAAHHRLRQIAQRPGRFPHAVQIANRIADSILHDPLDLDDVQIAGQHQRLVRKIPIGETRALGPRAFLGAETELLLQHAFRSHELHPVEAKRQLEMQPRISNTDDAAEALDNGSLLRLHRVKRTKRGPSQKSESDDDGDLPRSGTAGPARTAASSTGPVGDARCAQQLFDQIF